MTTTFFDKPLAPVMPTPPPAEPTPTPEIKSGGDIPTRVTTHTAPRKRGLLDRIEEWLTR